jgi:hypothetical protein
MLRTIAAAGLALALAFTAAPASAASLYKGCLRDGDTPGNFARIRIQPWEGSVVIGRIFHDEVVLAHQSANGFRLITDAAGTTGWVRSNLLCRCVGCGL